jgi:hypothetical protein
MLLHVRPLWRDKAELLEECLLRCDGVEQRDEVNKMKMGALEKFLLTKTSTGCVLGKWPTNGVRVCDIALVMHELHARNMEVIGDESENVLRNKLERQSQLEDEYLGLACESKDLRFDVNKWGILENPKRHLIDLVHLSMRTNEKMIHLMKMKILDRRGGKTTASQHTLDRFDDAIRKLGNLGAKWVSGTSLTCFSCTLNSYKIHLCCLHRSTRGKRDVKKA